MRGGNRGGAFDGHDGDVILLTESPRRLHNMRSRLD
jgi:hypothetical protein